MLAAGCADRRAGVQQIRTVLRVGELRDQFGHGLRAPRRPELRRGPQRQRQPDTMGGQRRNGG